MRRQAYIIAYLLLLLARSGGLDAIARLDNVGLEGDRARSAVQLEEEATCVAEDRTDLIASPERSRRCGAVLARWLGHLVSLLVHRVLELRHRACGCYRNYRQSKVSGGLSVGRIAISNFCDTRDYAS